MSKIIVILVSILLSVFTFVNADNTKNNKLKICYTDWGIIGGEQLPGKGVLTYVASKVLENAGYEVEVDILNWSRCLKSTRDQDYDMVAGLWESKSLEKDYHFLKNSNTIVVGMYFFTNVNSGINTGDMDALKGKSVVYVRDSGGTAKFYDREKEFKIYRVEAQKQSIEMILNGRADLTIASDIQFLKLLKDEYPKQASQLKILYPVIQANYTTPAMSINHPRYKEISQKYNKSYKELVKKGLYKELETVFNFKFEHRPSKQ